jgi:hypothetical protein
MRHCARVRQLGNSLRVPGVGRNVRQVGFGKDRKGDGIIVVDCRYKLNLHYN